MVKWTPIVGCTRREQQTHSGGRKWHYDQMKGGGQTVLVMQKESSTNRPVTPRAPEAVLVRWITKEGISATERYKLGDGSKQMAHPNVVGDPE